MRNEENIYPDFGDELPPSPIDSVELSSRLESELLGWRLVESPLPENPFKIRKELYKKFSFESFNKVVDYLEDLKAVCDILPHHPRIENVWATLEVYLSTWAINHDISYKDIQLAKNMDRLYNEKYKTTPQDEPRIIEENLVFINEVKHQISMDEIDGAILQLYKFFIINMDKNVPNEFILVKARHSSYLTQLQRGTLSTEELTKEINSIRHSLILFVDDMARNFG